MKFDHKALIQWFETKKRPLPWRNNPTPYEVWVSEIMLQQTQVSVVVPYFERWMRLFPTIESLAKASLDTVIKCWEGLGYYSRARALHAGAQYIIDQFQGILPSNEEDLRKIKGIGPYTTGAIRSFAFKQKAPAVDGNVIRVLSRYFAIADDINKTPTIKEIWAVAQKILPDEEPWAFNEALIELGATVCKRKPNCYECPVKDRCKAYAQGNPEEYPYQSKKIKIEHLHRAVAVIRCRGMLLVRREVKGKIMSDLHEFPYLELTEKDQSPDLLINFIEQSLGLKVSFLTALENISHSFTRYNVKLYPAVYVCSSPKEVSGYQWVSIPDLKNLAFSSGHRRLLEKFIERH